MKVSATLRTTAGDCQQVHLSQDPLTRAPRVKWENLMLSVCNLSELTLLSHLWLMKESREDEFFHISPKRKNSKKLEDLKTILAEFRNTELNFQPHFKYRIWNQWYPHVEQAFNCFSLTPQTLSSILRIARKNNWGIS